jgi:hypothetical protein
MILIMVEKTASEKKLGKKLAKQTIRWQRIIIKPSVYKKCLRMDNNWFASLKKKRSLKGIELSTSRKQAQPHGSTTSNHAANAQVYIQEIRTCSIFLHPS